MPIVKLRINFETFSIYRKMKNRSLFDFLTFFCVSDKQEHTKSKIETESTGKWRSNSLRRLKEKSDAFIKAHQKYEKFLEFDSRARKLNVKYK